MIKRLIVCFISCLFLCGCTKKQDVEYIDFASWGSITEVNILKKVISDFEKENPKVKINFIHIPQNYFQKIHLLFASNTAPDVIFVNNLYLPMYQSKLLDITSEFETDIFFPQAIESLSYKNKLLAIPRDISNLVLYINLDLTNLPSEDWNIEELLEKSISSTSNSHWGISFEDDIYWMSPYLSYFGESIYSFPKTLTFYKNLRDKYKVAPNKSDIGSSTLAQMFLEQKIAMYLSGRWMYPKISECAKFNWAVVNFPYGEKKQKLDSSGWAISKDSKHKKTAIKFIKYLSREDVSKLFAESGLIIPAQKQVAQILNNEKHNEKAFIKVISHSDKNSVDKNYKKTIDDINRKVFN